MNYEQYINESIKYITLFGRYCLEKLYCFLNKIKFFIQILYSLFSPYWYTTEIKKQIINIGYNSILVVSVSAISSGAVLALQVYTGMSSSGLNVDDYFSQVIMSSIIREIGPMTTALMVSGRISSSIAAELGTMKVSNQIDAMTMLNKDPIRYLIAPRIIAAVAMLPLLVCMGNAIGILGAYIVSVTKLHVSEGIFLNSLDYIRFMDIFSSLIKAVCFGLIISFSGCISGFHSGVGANGVGRASINAVVSSYILILISNYFITDFFMKN